MTDTPDVYEALVAEALSAHKAEYKELSDGWRSLDNKAQGAVAIAGLFLAGIFAFVRDLLETSGPVERCLLTVTVSFLALSVGFALGALWVRTVRGAPLGDAVGSLVSDLLRSEDGLSSERLRNYYHDYARLWKATNLDVERINKCKAVYLIVAQIGLALAILCTVAATFIRVWT